MTRVLYKSGHILYMLKNDEIIRLSNIRKQSYKIL